MNNKIDTFIYLIPRILSILFLLFLAVFSLDVLDMDSGFWGTIAGLFMHNVPTLILLAVVILSWKREIVGGVAFILAGMVYVGGLLKTILETTPRPWYMLSWSLIIAGPAFLIGILFILGWYEKKKG